MNRELIVLLNAEQVGVLRQRDTGELEFEYDLAWQDRSDSYPLSLSLPLSPASHDDSVVRPFVAGLLPDNEEVLDAWGRQLQVSPRNPFALLTHMGEDCAGAVQFVLPERLDSILTGETTEVEWLTENEVGQRLRDLVKDHGTGRRLGDPGYFSLAGAQPKTALLCAEGRWGIPPGRIPTTHIVKPPAQKDFSEFEVNEHYCLALARELGLGVAASRVQWFDGQAAIVIERYDRVRLPSGEVVRIHQEDACQALAVSPSRKYESEGGPGAVEIADLLSLVTDDPDRDVGTFFDALSTNWVICDTDAHAKNYSLLIQPASVQLSPLYDLVSALPYKRAIPYRKARLAMHIGSTNHVWKVMRRHWSELARRCQLDEGPVVARVGELVASVPEAATRAAESLAAEGVESRMIETLQAEITVHAERCLERLEGEGE
jgi:serine/threonine-protein kinase HipA